MNDVVLFTFADYWWFYLAFTGLILVILALDLGVFHKKAHEVSFKEASIWTTIWIGLALVFNWVFYKYALWKFATDERYLSLPGFNPAVQAQATGLEFLTGFLVEKSLAIDNIFVFAVVFAYFAIPKMYQHRILFWGILGALVFRAIFIAMGSVLMQYHWVIIFFGVLLIATGIKMFFAGTKKEDLSNNLMIRSLKKIFKVHPQIEGQKFFIRKKGLLYVTPLFIALVFLELSDIIFAIDSVPAIFALTKEPLIVYTSNIFAILGLRSMYFMLAGVVDKFVYIKYGLASVLVFVGLKMVWLNEAFGGKFPIIWSLGIIGALISLSIIASLIFKKSDPNTAENNGEKGGIIMKFGKRILLFLAVNILIITTLSVVMSLIGVQPWLDSKGINYQSLIFFCLVWGFGGAFISLALSRVMAKWMMGVQIIDPETGDPELRNLVMRVHDYSRKAGLAEMPQVGIYEGEELNAFATGPTQKRSLVAVSTGLLRNMDSHEVNGVLAHEVAHIANGDMVTMTLIQGVVNAFVMFFARIAAFFASQWVSEEKRPFMQFGVTIALEIALGILGMIVVASFSRRREYRADEGGALLASPGQMIQALERLKLNYGLPQTDEQPALATLKISGKSGGFAKLFSTHPDLDDRILRLRTLQSTSRIIA